jgi:hypothetical protein
MPLVQYFLTEGTMTTKYITEKTSPLFESSTGNKRKMVLIYGDEVKTTGSEVNKRFQSEFRGREGFISENHLGNAPVLEIYFIDVGQGDSTFIVTPKRKKILIDGGIGKRAFGFLFWKYMLERDGSPINIDLLVLSHADKDHIEGLIPIIKHPKINVKRVIHNGIAIFKKDSFKTALGNLGSDGNYLVSRHDSINELRGLPLDSQFESWRQAIAREGVSYTAVDSSMGKLNIGDPDIKIEILGPRLDTYKGKPAYRWFEGEGPTINGHSVVFRLTYRNISVLFSGDINKKGSKNLLQDPSITPRLDAHIYKAPHHGSHDFDKFFLRAVNPQLSIISSGDEPDHGQPRAAFIGAIGRVSRSAEPLVFSTQIAATFAEGKDERGKDEEPTSEEGLASLDVTKPEAVASARIRFKRRLHRMINVRTDGDDLFAARRVAAGYWWESYGPITPSPGSWG